MRKLILLITAFAAACHFALAVAGGNFAVIVNKNNSNVIDQKLLVKIYTGETRQWPSGGAITAYDLASDSPVREAFAKDVLNKTVSAMRSLWARNVFIGKATPPKELASDADVKKTVSENPDAIGYISASSVDGSVKVVFP